MELRIDARNLELNDGTRDYITRKMDRLSRHLRGITEATVELSRENTRAQDARIVAQITLDIDGAVLRERSGAPMPWQRWTPSSMSWTGGWSDTKGKSTRAGR